MLTHKFPCGGHCEHSHQGSGSRLSELKRKSQQGRSAANPLYSLDPMHESARRNSINPQTRASIAWEAADNVGIKSNSFLFLPAPQLNALEIDKNEPAEPSFDERSHKDTQQHHAVSGDEGPRRVTAEIIPHGSTAIAKEK